MNQAHGPQKPVGLFSRRARCEGSLGTVPILRGPPQQNGTVPLNRPFFVRQWGTRMEVAGRRITVMGLGRHGGGVAAARWLAERGAQVTVTDVAGAETLQSSIAALSDVPIAQWRLDGHEPSDFSAADA